MTSGRDRTAVSMDDFFGLLRYRGSKSCGEFQRNFTSWFRALEMKRERDDEDNEFRAS